MPNYLYNGIELFDINQLWDKEKYPYAVIWDDTGDITLICSTSPWWLDKDDYNFCKSVAIANGNTFSAQSYEYNGFLWESSVSHNEVDYDAVTFPVSLLVWSSADIYDNPNGGTLCFSASEPDSRTAVTMYAPKDSEWKNQDFYKVINGAWVKCNKYATQGHRWAKGVFGEESIAYLYNGVKLPKLPEWDKQEYPYAYIAYNIYYEERVSVNPEYSLIVAANPFYFSFDVKRDKGKYIYYGYCPTDGETDWSVFTTGDGGQVLYVSYFASVWSNTDIMSTRENFVYLYGTEPVPFTTMPQQTECLYNGVKLPELPSDVDRQAYPYCMIRVSTIHKDGYAVYYSSVPFTFCTVDGGGRFYAGVSGNYVPIMLYEYNIARNDWELVMLNNSSGWGEIKETSYLLWSDHNIINTDDNTVYLAESDPVPVEPEQPTVSMVN